jgi:ribonucrease Y
MGSAVLAEISSQLIVAVIVSLLLGGAASVLILSVVGRNRRESARHEAARLLEEARHEAEGLVKAAQIDAKDEFLKRKEQFDKESQETRTELREVEKRLEKREDNLEKKLDTLLTKEKGLEKTEKSLADREKTLAIKERQIDQALTEQRDQLVRISGMSVEDAKQQLFRNLERETELEAWSMIEKRLADARDTAEAKAREIVITAIQRYAVDQTCEATVSTVAIPSDDMKGRVIGREGRNIRSFEKATGVDVIVDDTPGVVVVSAFDPVRREVARQSLERLIQDGRIHPARIEELVEDTRRQVEQQIIEIGKKAAMEANVGGLHRKQIDLLGRLSFRTSYGQNVLRHSIEVAYLCQIMADELGLDGKLARRCGLLHDIGKAVEHEVEGGHPQIGADICKRFNERPEVLNAIAGHHGDVEATSPYTPLVSAADAVSAARPGSRRESLERYIKRLEQLEAIATTFQGVKQAYAIQAGREVRVIVDANRVDDNGALRIARDIAKQIEQDMSYPGEVKVTLLREVRAVEYAR